MIIVGALLQTATSQQSSLYTESDQLKSTAKDLRSIKEDLEVSNNEPSLIISAEKLGNMARGLEGAAVLLISAGNSIVSTAQKIEAEEAAAAAAEAERKAAAERRSPAEEARRAGARELYKNMDWRKK